MLISSNEKKLAGIFREPIEGAAFNKRALDIGVRKISFKNEAIDRNVKLFLKLHQKLRTS